MGMLDFVKKEAWVPPVSDDEFRKESVPLLCSLCNKEFLGERWMMTTKKDVTCRDCYESTRSFYDNYN